MRQSDTCGCIPPSVDKNEIEKIDRYFKGENIAGFPPHSKEKFTGHCEGVPEFYMRDWSPENRFRSSFETA